MFSPRVVLFFILFVVGAVALGAGLYYLLLPAVRTWTARGEKKYKDYEKKEEAKVRRLKK